MAKGIAQFGTLSGTLGDTVYYRSGGEQKQRIRVRRVNNPKTRQQMFQRAKFSAAGMFYAHGKQNFFPYAFEDKKKGESNFNAFMRNNVKQAWPISKTMADTKTYPVFNNWLMTKGSLRAFQVAIPENRQEMIVGSIVYPDEIATYTTMAELSRALIATGDFENLDVITFVSIEALNLVGGSEPYPVVSGSDEEIKPATWRILQFNLNVNDNNTLASYGIAADHDGVEISISCDSLASGNFMNAAAVIHSRKTKSSTKVSTQTLVLNKALTEQVEQVTGISGYGTESNLKQDYVNAVVDDWLGIVNLTLRPTEVLQGANSVNFKFENPPVNPG